MQKCMTFQAIKQQLAVERDNGEDRGELKLIVIYR